MNVGEHYESRRTSVSALVGSLDAAALAIRVPGCPQWSVRELLSHLTALPYDVQNGLSEGAGSDPWTARQVAERQDRSVAELLTEWQQWGPPLAAVLADLGAVGWRIIADASLHEDDLREALGLPLATSATHALVLEGLIRGAADRVDAAGLPALVVAAGNRSWSVGAGEPIGTMTVADSGELSRALGGRRSAADLAGYVWDVDATPYLSHLPLVISPV